MTIIPGLTPAQLKARAKGIGGSDAKKIMAGLWLELWNEKTGRVKPDDLSNVLPVQMGNWTEELNAYWYTKQTGITVNRAKKIKEATMVHPVHRFMVCNLDGLAIIDARARVWDAKHTNPFNPDNQILDDSYAQMQHNIEVSGTEGAELSVFYGNLRWARFSIERDRDYISELLQREEEFWSYVQKDTPPPADAAEAIKRYDPNAPKIVDMRFNNAWQDAEVRWLEAQPWIVKSDSALEQLRGLIEGDVGFAYGNELVASRSKDNKLSIRLPNKTDSHRRTVDIEEGLQRQAIADRREQEKR